MATLSTRTAHPVAVIDTERVYVDSDGTEEVIREKWALRSDGKILRRIVWTEPVDKSGEPRWYAGGRKGGKTHRLVHNNGYTHWRALKAGVPVTRETLEGVLSRSTHLRIVEA